MALAGWPLSDTKAAAGNTWFFDAKCFVDDASADCCGNCLIEKLIGKDCRGRQQVMYGFKLRCFT